MATTYLEMTQGTPTSTRKCTYSGWHKKSEAGPSVSQSFFSIGLASDSHYTDFRYETDDAIRINIESAAGYTIKTTRLFRDPAAWYHVVIAIDTEQSTAADRIKLYINGVQETSFSETNYPAEDYDIPTLVSGDKFSIGRRIRTGTMYFNGNMSHVQFVDGLQLAPTEFGLVETTSGIWKIKTGCYATPGTNGFCLKMEDRTNLDLDSSSNAHTFTTTGTLTPTSDTPSNNFATFNPNMVGTGATVSNGNCSFASGSSINNALVAPTLAASKGKWYWEAQVSHACAAFGISDTEKLAEEKRNNQANGISSGNQSISWEGNGYMKYSGTQVAYGDAMADATLGGTTLGFFADLDNNKLYLAEDGVIQNSGTGYTITAPASTDSGYYYLGVCGDQCSATSNVQGYVNFGNGVFHTTLLTGTTYSDAGGTGVFKYSPNQGGAANFDSAAKDFYAVCTKNIKAYG